MTCNSCGTDLPPNGRFCFKCGTSSEAAAPAPSPLPAPADHGAAAAPATAVAEPPPQVAPGPATVPFSQSHSGPSARTWSEADRRPFRHGGRWWARASTGGVLTWDEARNAWETPLSALTPFFMRRKRFASLQAPALWLYIFFGVLLFVTAVALVVDVTLINATSGLDGDDLLVFSDAHGEYEGFIAAKGFQGFAVLCIPAFFLWWLRRATLNLPSFGSVQQGFGSGWAIGAWFIPLGNMVLPLLVVNQAWRGSDPGLSPEENVEWKRAPLSPLIIFWWLAYIIGGIVWSASTNPGNDDYAVVWDARLAAWAGVAGDLLMVTATILAILMVAALTRRQDAADRRFGSIAAE